MPLMPTSPKNNKIPVGISSCLLGENVRYNGEHSYVPLIIEQLSEQLDLIPICPEMAIGLGVPRDPIQLVKTRQGIRVLGVADSTVDVTDRLEQFASSAPQESPGICGHIFKSRSPSCGIGDVEIFDTAGQLLDNNGTGIYANTILQTMNGLPVTDETLLQEEKGINQFIEQVIQYHCCQ